TTERGHHHALPGILADRAWWDRRSCLTGCGRTSYSTRRPHHHVSSPSLPHSHSVLLGFGRVHVGVEYALACPLALVILPAERGDRDGGGPVATFTAGGCPLVVGGVRGRLLRHAIPAVPRGRVGVRRVGAATEAMGFE